MGNSKKADSVLEICKVGKGQKEFADGDLRGQVNKNQVQVKQDNLNNIRFFK